MRRTDERTTSSLLHLDPDEDLGRDQELERKLVRFLGSVVITESNRVSVEF